MAQLVEALSYKSEVRGFDPPMVSLEFFIDIILPFNSVSNINEYIYCGFKTSSDAFRLPYSIAFDCSIHPFLDFFHSWLYIYPIFPGSLGAASFFPSFRFPVNRDFW
jgi:hypothetical protein